MKQEAKYQSFIRHVEQLNLRFPVAAIAEKTGFSKGNVSNFLKGKKEPSDNFYKTFYEEYEKDGHVFNSVNEEKEAEDSYLDQRRKKMLQEKESWFPVMQGNTRLKEQGNMTVYEDDPEMQIPIAFLPQNMYPGCDYGERAFGNSMYPRIVNQGFALGKIISKYHIKYGELYGMHFKQPEGGPPTVKYVRKCKEDENCVVLIADNQHVEDQVIKLDEITFMFRVLYIVNPA